MSEFTPKVGLITKDAYLHGCGTLDNIGNTGKIVYVGENYFLLEDLYNKTGILVERNSYWVVQETDFYEQK